jgi:hypothetical protein
LNGGRFSDQTSTKEEAQAMTTKFNSRECAAMRAMGLPEDIDEFFDKGQEFVDEASEDIEDELLGPGIDMETRELNEYGEALRSTLDAIACRARELR